MMEAIDRKFKFIAVHTTKKTIFTEDDAVLFLAKDAALPATLKFYHQECRGMGADPKQLEGIKLLIDRVDQYQRMNPKRVKVPDVDDGPEAAVVLKPNA